MVEGLPVNYRRYGEGSIASYDWINVADGTGIITLYGAVTQQGTTEDYILTTSTPYSHKIEVSGGNTWSQNFDLSPFNLPRNIKGTAYLNATWAARDDTEDNFIYANLQKWDGTTETTLASTSGGWVNPLSAAPRTDLLIFPEITNTHFKKGDVLRLEVGFVSLGSHHNILCADPQNRDGIWIKPSTTAITNKLTLSCPFQIDL